MLSVAHLDVSSLDLDKAKKYVSNQRLIKAEKLKSIDAKKESLGAELLLSSLFGINFPDADLPPQIAIGESGKPYFAQYPVLHFSISHSNLHAACVISDCLVGIDLQYMRSFDERLIKRFFTSDEQEFYNNAEDKKIAFYTIWTRKEALLKCIGTGLCNISTMSVFDAENNGYSFSTEYFDNFTLCVCKKK